MHISEHTVNTVKFHVSPTEDYAEEAAFFARLFRESGVRALLELGSGGGNVAWFLKKDFSLTLTDPSPEMLAESKKQNPELEYVEGGMLVLRLGRTFDGVLIHDAIMYMNTEGDLRTAVPTAYRVLWYRCGKCAVRPGGSGGRHSHRRANFRFVF